MNLFILLISFFCSLQPVWAINYFRCDQTSDCTKTYGGCGRYTSVHKRYKELYESKAQVGDRTVNCIAPTEKDKQYKFEGEAICMQNKCKLVLPKKESPETK